jgi:amino acid adenylation domain-containing protein/non-ribosomal peptide synthase protein (TIGR01720 family)
LRNQRWLWQEERSVIESHQPSGVRWQSVHDFVLRWIELSDDGAARHGVDGPLRLQSLQAAELAALIETRFGVRVGLKALLAGPTPEELVALVCGHENGDAAGDQIPALRSEPDDRLEPFPLTEMQRAYMLGRTGGLDLGGYSTHAYYQFSTTGLDIARLQTAFERVVARHEMLRAVMLPDGCQRVLDDDVRYPLTIQDLRDVPPAEAAVAVRAVQDRVAHQVFDPERGPLFEMCVQELAAHEARVHVSVDLLIADAQSLMLVMKDWARFYERPDEIRDPPAVSFRDYVITCSSVDDSGASARARDYWQGRLESLPAAPMLPLLPALTQAPKYVRRERVLETPGWERLQHRANSIGVTPSALVCTAFSRVLAHWAEHRQFTLNLTLGERLPLHPDIEQVVGDFTSSLLLEVDLRGDANIDVQARSVHRQLTEDLEHRAYPGTAVQRDLARLRGSQGAVVPVVFTSLLDVDLAHATDPALAVFGPPTCGLTQTPQVHLDHQAYILSGALHLVWDAAEERFPPGLLDAMLDSYAGLLNDLAEGETRAMVGHPPPLAAGTDERPPAGAQLLHAGIARQVAERPDAPAVIAGEQVISYGELDRCARELTSRLCSMGARPGTVVAVVMDKGWEQVAAALGIVRAGAAYLPIDAHLPERRIHELLELGRADVAVVQRDVDGRLAWPESVRRVLVEDIPPSDASSESPIAIERDGNGPAAPGDLAYLIFTSGSTGTPKGVMIEHGAAANTIVDCIERFELTPEDRVFGISSLSFDLSVFDVFATLRSGATLVLPEPHAARDPGRWAALVRRHGITVWNSVPALLEMLVEYAAERTEAIGRSLRLAMLSGDWIPVDLPDRLRALVPRARIVSMGGATEASIWSVIYEVGAVDPAWTSIPYGTGMTGQRLYVLDSELIERPVWATGEIFIAGAGLARGYWQDPTKTAERFIEHPATGERLYRTGDLGRYLPDGNIEFLGRTDSQVKVHGHRVELGEIEAALNEHPEVITSVVSAHGARTGAKRLVAYCRFQDEPIGACDLRQFLGGRLPEYMVPQTFMSLDRVPLTANGKVDRAALPAPQWAAPSAGPDAGADETGAGSAAVERVLTEIWSAVLDLPSVGRDDDFFDLGGDSLLAMRVIARAGAAGIRLEPDNFFEHPTIAEMAASATADPVAEAAATAVRGRNEGQDMVTGAIPVTPSQAWFFAQDFSDSNHWNGFWPLLEVETPLDPALLGAALHLVMLHHDGLRARFHTEGGAVRATINGPEGAVPVPLEVQDLSMLEEPELTETLEATCAAAQSSLDLAEGPVLRMTYFKLGGDRSDRLHLAAHWVVLDYYSSRVFFEDLMSAYQQLSAGSRPELPPKTASVHVFSQKMRELARAEATQLERELWTSPERRAVAPLPVDHDRGPNDQLSTRQLLVMLDPDATSAILRELPRRWRCTVADGCAAAIAQAVCRWAETESMLIEVEAHGRWDVLGGVDLSRTVGRCSTFTPLLLRRSLAPEPEVVLSELVSQIHAVPQHGIGYGLLRYAGDPADRAALADLPQPELNFNYWGHSNEYLAQAIMPFDESPGPLQAAAGHRPRLIDVFGLVYGGQLALTWSYSRSRHRRGTIEALAIDVARQLLAFVGLQGDDADLEPVELEKSILHSTAQW